MITYGIIMYITIRFEIAKFSLLLWSRIKIFPALPAGRSLGYAPFVKL